MAFYFCNRLAGSRIGWPPAAKKLAGRSPASEEVPILAAHLDYLGEQGPVMSWQKNIF